MSDSVAQTTLNVACEDVRRKLKEIGAYVKSCANTMKGQPEPTVGDKGEMIANLILTYRHLEDASMRLGKVIQAYDGGVSVYDKNTVMGEIK